MNHPNAGHELTVAHERVHVDEDLAAPPTRLRKALYRAVDLFLICVGKVLFRVTVIGRENIPASGPYILAPVHRSNLDFAFVLACPGAWAPRMRYLAKDTLWKGPLGKLWIALGAIPVHRGTPDRDALATCVRILQAGEPLVIFPEGTRQSGEQVAELFDGVAYMQAKTQVPVIPVGIGGSEAAMPKGAKFIHPTKVVLLIGEPLAPPAQSESGRVRRSSVAEQTQHLRDVLQTLFDRARAQVTEGQ